MQVNNIKQTLWIQPFVKIVSAANYTHIGYLNKDGDMIPNSEIEIGATNSSKKTHLKTLGIKG